MKKGKTYRYIYKLDDYYVSHMSEHFVNRYFNASWSRKQNGVYSDYIDFKNTNDYLRFKEFVESLPFPHIVKLDFVFVLDHDYEINEWLEEHFDHMDYYENLRDENSLDYIYMFKNKEEAVAFKLMWV